MSEILRCVNLSKSYGKNEALHPLNLTLESGRIIGLLGPNGSGKTTLIKMICGLLTPSGGEIYADGKKIGPETKAVISYLPERTYIPEHMKVKEIIAYFCDFYADFRKDVAEEMLRKLNINTESKIKTLSKGTKEKVQLILVMSRRAKLFLLDEPIGGVDPAARDYILRTIIGNYSEDASVIITTHLIADIEPIIDNFAFMKNGKIFMSGVADEVRENTGKSLDVLFREVFK